MELDENVQPASSRRSYTLSKDVLPAPLETLVVTIVGSTELDGIPSASIPNRLLEDWANSRSTDTFPITCISLNDVHACTFFHSLYL